ncbi:metal-dependent hydrolase [Natronorubrum sp. A-ect3]|uniref:metal-dependent hydrolase n=1 Tax=Natronorubrum sp. A-ect3 TaxID=3242698 RepID=UPI00359D35D8
MPVTRFWVPVVVGLIVAGGVYSIGGGVFAQLAAIWGVAAFVSVTAHPLADSLTPAGVAPFCPVSDARYSLALVQASNPIANGFLFLLGLAATATAVSIGVT